METSKIVLMVVLAVVVIAEVFLSHQNGKDSGAASKSLSNRLHLSEAVIRTGAHIGFFAVMTILSLLSYPVFVVVVGLWAVVDEMTKPLLKNERHCSVVDIGWNVLGCVIGFGVWMVTRSL